MLSLLDLSREVVELGLAWAWDCASDLGLGAVPLLGVPGLSWCSSSAWEFGGGWPFGSPWDLWRSLRSWGWLRFGWCLFRGRFSQPWRLGAGSSRWAQAVRRIRTLQTTFFYLWVGGICLGTLVLCPLRGLLSTWDVEFDRAKHTLSHSGQLRHDFVHSTLRGSWWRGCSSGSSSSSSCSLSAIVSLLHLLGDASSWCGSNRDIPGHSRSSARIHFTTGFGPGLRSFGGPPGIHWRCGGFDKWVFADRGKGATTSGKGAG